MKFLAFILLVITISAVHLAADPNNWHEPSYYCATVLRGRVENIDGKLAMSGYHYDQTCDDTLIN